MFKCIDWKEGMAEPLMFQINLLYDEMIPFGLFEDQ